MSPELKEWLEYSGKVDAEKRAKAVPQLEAQRRVALDMTYVTGSEQWDVYLQHLQAMVEADEKIVEGLEKQLSSPMLCDPNETTRIRLNLIGAKNRVMAIRQAMELPKQLMERVASGSE